MTKDRLSRRGFLRAGAGLLASTSGAVLAGCAAAEGGVPRGQGPIDATIAGASPTGYFRSVGETINQIVRDHYPGSSIGYKPGSPAGALAQVADGRADFALAITPVEEQLADIGAYPFVQPLPGRYRGVMEIHRKGDFASVARRAWAVEHGIRSWADIARVRPPLRIGINQPGNIQIVQVAESLLGEYGITFDDIAAWGGRVVYEPGGVTPGLLKDRKIDMYFNAQFQPISDLVEVSRTGVELSWISMDEEAMRATAQRWGNLTTTIEAGTYDWLDHDVATIRQHSDMIVRPDLPDDVVYRVTRAILRSSDRMGQISRAMRDFSPEGAVRVRHRVPLHPGAERYYREIGLI